ncbi:MAG: DUF6527 family protein [Desulfobulbus sp.]
MPDALEDGVLYVCERYGTAIHKCCCGCGEEVVTPLSAADWAIHRKGQTVTLTPSIGNWSFACRSHYLIRNNQVVLAERMTQSQINRVRARDRADKAAYIKAINARKSISQRGFWSRLIDFVRNLLY